MDPLGGLGTLRYYTLNTWPDRETALRSKEAGGCADGDGESSAASCLTMSCAYHEKGSA